jgi:hypothetical protein
MEENPKEDHNDCGFGDDDDVPRFNFPMVPLYES